MSSADFDPGLAVGTVLTNRELADTFRCSPQSGMRRSLRTNSLVLTTSRDGLYLDRWVNGHLHYTGMGLRGDQDLFWLSNRTLAESRDNGVAVFLVEVFGPNQYVFLGRVELADDPYPDEQPDDDGRLRKVWMFPLRLLEDGAEATIPEALFERAEEARSRRARRLSDEELEERARLAAATPGQRSSTSTSYERDLFVSELAKRIAGGICQLCDAPAPFKSRRGEPYLETHHIVWLARGGEDSIENTVALCPNCHRRVHELESAADVEKLRARASTGQVGADGTVGPQFEGGADALHGGL